jgi:hypothetical protein
MSCLITDVVRFDNTYSYFRSKKISYLIEVLEPDTVEVEIHTFDKTNVSGDKSELCIDSTVDEDTAFHDAKDEHGERKEIKQKTQKHLLPPPTSCCFLILAHEKYYFMPFISNSVSLQEVALMQKKILFYICA